MPSSSSAGIQPETSAQRPRQQSKTTSTTLHTSTSSAQIKCYQQLIPTEIWRHIVEYIPTLDLFSLYNTSTYMRAISAPSLVQAMASKTIQLYFYQEYVRRIGIKFEFDHFDLKRDRIVFRPQVLDLQHRFRSGLTLQNPHLEELAVFSPSNSKIPSNQVRCTEGRYYTVHSNCGTRRMPPKTPLVASSALAGLTGLEPLSEPSSEAAVNSTVEAATTAVANRTERMSQKKSQVDQRGYHGTKNFLDKSSPIQIRKDGIHELDGSKYCFLQEYPWSLQYQISYEPFGVPLSYNDKDSKKREQFFFDLRADLRSEAQARAQAQQQPETNVGNITESNNDNNNDGVIEGESALPSTSTTTTTTTTNSGSNASRYFRVLRFECSMNFLDLKRATRNIIGRWLEGKVQRWKKVLGVKRPALQHIQQQQQTESLSDSADSSSRNVSRSGKTKHSSRKVIQVIDSILGPPAKTLSSLDNDAGRQNPGSSSDSGENSDNFVHVNSTSRRNSVSSNNSNISSVDNSTNSSFSVQPSLTDFHSSGFSLSTVTAY